MNTDNITLDLNSSFLETCGKEPQKVVCFLQKLSQHITQEALDRGLCIIANQSKEYLGAVSQLLHLGADVDSHTTHQKIGTVLMAAAKNGHVNIILLLINKGVTINAKTDLDKVALIQASENGQIEAVKILIDNGADVNIQAPNGYTPLMAASKSGYFAIVKFLVRNGANVTMENNEEWSAADFAEWKENKKIFDFLEKAEKDQKK